MAYRPPAPVGLDELYNLQWLEQNANLAESNDNPSFVSDLTSWVWSAVGKRQERRLATADRDEE
jgi:hypothetical protein